MELHHLRYFLKVAETLHFTRAAEELYVTQPALSQQIKQLEDELGAPLFSRIGRKIQLTEAGILFKNYAMSAISEVEKGERAIANLKNLVEGTIRIGVMYSYFGPLLPLLDAYSRKYPNVNICITYSNNEELMDKLLSSQLDIALTFDGDVEVQDDLEIKGTFDTHLALAVNTKSPLAKLKTFSLFDLSDQLLALPVSSNIIRRTLTQFFKKNKIEPHIHVEVNDLQLLLDTVEVGNFVSIVTNTAVVTRKNIKLIPIQEKLKGPRGVILIQKSGYLNKASQLMLQEIVERMKTFH